MAKSKWTKGQRTTQKTKDLFNTNPIKIGVELGCFGR